MHIPQIFQIIAFPKSMLKTHVTTDLLVTQIGKRYRCEWPRRINNLKVRRKIRKIRSKSITLMTTLNEKKLQIKNMCGI